MDLVRHYMDLSRKAYGVDNLFYPLGSCTMKYNPKINEAMASLPGFTDIHPLQPEETAQGVSQTKIAMDGIAVIVNLENTVEDLTAEQIRQIFTGEMTTWE